MPASDDEAPRLARLWPDRHTEHAAAIARDMIVELQESENDAGAGMWRRHHRDREAAQS